jgi:hypothetical protein
MYYFFRNLKEKMALKFGINVRSIKISPLDTDNDNSNGNSNGNAVSNSNGNAGSKRNNNLVSTL